MRPYTGAGLKMDTRIEYRGYSASEVFEILGDPQRITDWYLLARQVKMQPKVEGQEQAFNVEFTFFGDVYEEVLYWDPPRRYVYSAQGAHFPIKDYVAKIEVEESAPKSGIMSWQIYCDVIQGAEFRRILPVMLPAITEASMQKLASLIGGVSCDVKSFFKEE